jgi:methionine sulfoxide reductase heme-binding subunit
MNVITPLRVQAGKRERRKSFSADLRAAVPDALAALVLSGVVFAILMMRVRAGDDPAAREMPDMIGNGGLMPYTLSQAVGWAALLWAWLTILIGVSLPLWARQSRARFRETAEKLHRSTSLSLIALMVLHAVLLLGDKMGDTLVTDFVPFTTSYKPGLWPVALGIFSFYLALAIGGSFYLRDRIGLRLWRLTHRYVIPAVYVLALWHTFLYGSDVRAHNGLWIALWLLQLPIIAAFLVRMSLPFFSTTLNWRKS